MNADMVALRSVWGKSIAICVFAAAGAIAVQAQAQIPNAHYEGDHSYEPDYQPRTPGPRIVLDVSPNGTSATLTVRDAPYAPDITNKTVSIRDHRFVYEVAYPSYGIPPDCRPGKGLRVTGTFDAGQSVEGTILPGTIDCPMTSIDDVDWWTTPFTWSARTESPPVSDTTAPNTTISKRPKNRIEAKAPRTKVTYTFTSTEGGSSFQCKLDQRSWRVCGTPKTYKVPAGKHAFKVRAKDAVGNVDLSPAKDTFWVVR